MAERELKGGEKEECMGGKKWGRKGMEEDRKGRRGTGTITRRSSWNGANTQNKITKR